MKKLVQIGAIISLLAGAALQSGCGAGGGGSAAPGGVPAAGRGTLSLTVQFPPATRQTSGGIPTGTNAVKVELTDPATQADLAQPQIVPRPTSGNTATVSFSQIRAGAVHVTATAYADIAATQPLAVGQADGTVVANSTTSLSVSLTLGPVDHVTVSPSAVTLMPIVSVSAGVSSHTPIPQLPSSRATTPIPTSAVLTAKVLDSSGTQLLGFPIVWTSSDNELVIVTPNPTNPDQATITTGITPLTQTDVTVRATEPNTGKSATCTVTVVLPVVVNISPLASTVATGGTVQFTSHVFGTSNSNVTWSVTEGSSGGTIGTSGLYVAPAVPGTYHVVATSQANSNSTATTTVHVVGFTSDFPMNTARSNFTATPLNNGMILIAGGFTNSSTPTAQAELYNPTNDSFTGTGSLHVARAFHTATRLQDGTVLIAGGQGVSGGLTSAEIFNPANGQFTLLTATLNQPRELHTADLLSDGTVLLAGGDVRGSTTGSAEVYSPVRQSFAPVGSMITPRELHRTVDLSDGSVLAIGGIDAAGSSTSALASAERYVPSSQSWVADGMMTQSRSDLTATLLPSNMVLITGGDDGVSTTYSTAELFNPTSGVSTTAPNMSVARSGHTATLVNGEVLITGGASSSSVSATAELYNPATNTFSAAGVMSSPRVNHAAVLLSNGLVLVAGGDTGVSGAVLSSADLWHP